MSRLGILVLVAVSASLGAGTTRSVAQVPAGSPIPWPVVYGAGGTGTESVEYPFGQVSVSPDGILYYVDRQFGQIDQVTPSGARVVLSSLDGRAAPRGSISGLSGLYLTKDAMWFTAANGLYKATLAGQDVRRVADAPGAVGLDVLPDGTAYFTTATAVFEVRDGRTALVAGGTTVGFAEQQAGPHPATEEAINPKGVAGVSAQAFYFTNENRLYLVQRGVATMFGPESSFFNGELVTTISGRIYGICDWQMCRISGHAVSQLFKLPEPVHGVFAAPDALAVSPSGSFYISYSDQSLPGKAGIVELSPTGKVVAVVASRKT